ncbi:MAG: hypothetical protein AAF418_02440 [Pseudomonadota bacterium]
MAPSSKPHHPPATTKRKPKVTKRQIRFPAKLRAEILRLLEAGLTQDELMQMLQNRPSSDPKEPNGEQNGDDALLRTVTHRLAERMQTLLSPGTSLTPAQLVQLAQALLKTVEIHAHTRGNKQKTPAKSGKGLTEASIKRLLQTITNTRD